jgi:hypothetical protein
MSTKDGTVSGVRIAGSGVFQMCIYQDSVAAKNSIHNIMRVDDIEECFQVSLVPVVYRNMYEPELYIEITGGTGPFDLELLVETAAHRG